MSQRKVSVNPPERGFVYVAEAESERVKIGWTANPPDRFAKLERALGEDVYVWACVPGSREDERRLHAQWAHEHLTGEWFRASDELLAWAEGLGADQL